MHCSIYTLSALVALATAINVRAFQKDSANNVSVETSGCDIQYQTGEQSLPKIDTWQMIISSLGHISWNDDMGFESEQDYEWTRARGVIAHIAGTHLSPQGSLGIQRRYLAWAFFQIAVHFHRNSPKATLFLIDCDGHREGSVAFRLAESPSSGDSAPAPPNITRLQPLHLQDTFGMDSLTKDEPREATSPNATQSGHMSRPEIEGNQPQVSRAVYYTQYKSRQIPMLDLFLVLAYGLYKISPHHRNDDATSLHSSPPLVPIEVKVESYWRDPPRRMKFRHAIDAISTTMNNVLAENQFSELKTIVALRDSTGRPHALGEISVFHLTNAARKAG